MTRKEFLPRDYNIRLVKIKRNVTKMVIYTSIIFLLGNLLTPIIYTGLVVFKLEIEKHVVIQILALVSNTLQSASYGFNMFVCYAFNQKYRLVLKKKNFKWKK